MAVTRHSHKVFAQSSTLCPAILAISSMVERSAVNRRVVGSSPSLPVMGYGTARGGHLFCTQDIRWVRFPYGPFYAGSVGHR